MEGTTLGMVGGHKTVMALKARCSRQFSMGLLQKGTQSRSGRPQCFRARGWLPGRHAWCSEGSATMVNRNRELFLIADLAARYNLQRLSRETVEYAKGYIFIWEHICPLHLWLSTEFLLAFHWLLLAFYWLLWVSTDFCGFLLTLYWHLLDIMTLAKTAPYRK